MHISDHRPIQLILLFASISLTLQGCGGLTPTYADIESRGKVADANRSMSMPSQAAYDAGSDLTQPLLASQDSDNGGQTGASSAAAQASRKEVKILLDSLRMQHGERFWECRLQLPSKSKRSDNKLETGSVDTRVTQRTHRTTDQDHNLDANYVSFKYYTKPGFEYEGILKVVPTLYIYEWQSDKKCFGEYTIHKPDPRYSCSANELGAKRKSSSTFLIGDQTRTFIFHFELKPDCLTTRPHLIPADLDTVGALRHNFSNPELLVPEFSVYNFNRLNILQTGFKSIKSIDTFQAGTYHGILDHPQEKVLELQQKITKDLTQNLHMSSIAERQEGEQAAHIVNIDSLDQPENHNALKCMCRIAFSRPFLMLTASGLTLLLCKSYYGQK